jgi:hypothetical protein
MPMKASGLGARAPRPLAWFYDPEGKSLHQESFFLFGEK